MSYHKYTYHAFVEKSASVVCALRKGRHQPVRAATLTLTAIKPGVANVMVYLTSTINRQIHVRPSLAEPAIGRIYFLKTTAYNTMISSTLVTPATRPQVVHPAAHDEGRVSPQHGDGGAGGPAADAGGSGAHRHAEDGAS